VRGICALHQIADIPQIIERRTIITEIEGDVPCDQKPYRLAVGSLCL
jgi:hypothetical protein